MLDVKIHTCKRVLFLGKNVFLQMFDNYGMLSTDLTEFIRSVPIALSLTDRNETERIERIKPDSDTKMDNRTTETSERTYIYSWRVR